MRRDDGDAAAFQRAQHAVDPRFIVERILRGLEGAELRDVGAGSKCLVARACENDATQALRIERRILETAHEIAAHLGVERVGGIRPIEPDDCHMLVDRLDRKRLESGRVRTHVASQENPLPLRRIFPTEGEGKCAVQHSVSVLQ